MDSFMNCKNRIEFKINAGIISIEGNFAKVLIIRCKNGKFILKHRSIVNKVAL